MAKKTNNLKPVFKMGWLPDLPYARDFAYAAPLKLMQKMPLKADLRLGCPPVYNQGGLGSCTANALAGAFEFGIKNRAKQTLCPAVFFYISMKGLRYILKPAIAAPFYGMVLNH